MFIKWPSIEAFHNLVKHTRSSAAYNNSPYPDIVYRGKVKLHGTNAAVQIQRRGKVRAQSRTRIIDVGCDNVGFAAWVKEHKEHFEKYTDKKNDIIVYGEWCGQGVQRGTALNQLDARHFAIFAVGIGLKTGEDTEGEVVYDPDAIREYLPYIDDHDQIHVLPWHTEEFVVNWHNQDLLNEVVEVANKQVDEIDRLDPWVKDVFGVEGPGEGLVFYPINKSHSVPYGWFGDHLWKAKGESHQVVKTKKAVNVDPEVMASINEFVDKTVTEARLEQGVMAIGRGELIFETRLVGPFIGWVTKDVQKETKSEIEASGLEWKPVSKAVTARAREWYLAKMREI